MAAAWVDDEATTAALIDRHSISYPVAYGAGPDAVAKATGAFVNPEPRYLQVHRLRPRPAGKVLVSVCSSGVIGRLVLEGRTRPGALPA